MDNVASAYTFLWSQAILKHKTAKNDKIVTLFGTTTTSSFLDSAAILNVAIEHYQTNEVIVKLSSSGKKHYNVERCQPWFWKKFSFLESNGHVTDESKRYRGDINTDFKKEVKEKVYPTLSDKINKRR